MAHNSLQYDNVTGKKGNGAISSSSVFAVKNKESEVPLDLSNADSLTCYKTKIQLKIPVIIHAPLLVVLAALISPLLKISLWCGSNWKFLSPPCMDMTISGFFNFHCLTISSSVSSGLVLSASRIY